MVAKNRILNAVLLQTFCLCVGFGLAFGAMELPSKLQEIPLYTGSKIVQVMDMDNNSMAMLTVKADREAFLEYYKQNMRAKGWKVVFQAEQEDNAVIHFTKDKQTIQITVQNEEEGMLQYQLVSINQ